MMNAGHFNIVQKKMRLLPTHYPLNCKPLQLLHSTYSSQRNYNCMAYFGVQKQTGHRSCQPYDQPRLALLIVFALPTIMLC